MESNNEDFISITQELIRLYETGTRSSKAKYLLNFKQVNSPSETMCQKSKKASLPTFDKNEAKRRMGSAQEPDLPGNYLEAITATIAILQPNSRIKV